MNLFRMVKNILRKSSATGLNKREDGVITRTGEKSNKNQQPSDEDVAVTKRQSKEMCYCPFFPFL